MQINGKEMELDIFDLATAERYEAAIDRVAVRMQEMQKQDLGFAEGIRAQCEAVAEFLTPSSARAPQRTSLTARSISKRA